MQRKQALSISVFSSIALAAFLYCTGYVLSTCIPELQYTTGVISGIVVPLISKEFGVHLLKRLVGV